MIISRTPLRISFVGGGSDLASFYRRSPGAVVSMSVNKYFYLSLHPHFDEKGFLIKYSQTERVDGVDEIKHPIVRAIFERYGVDNADFASAADVPAGTGMGSSSSFTVGLLNLIHASQNRFVSQMDLAREACEIEIDVLGEPIGKQDQYGAALGGLKFIEFFGDKSVTVTPIHLSVDQRRTLESRLMLFYLGNQRSASKLLSTQNQKTATDEQVFRSLEKMSDQARSLRSDLCMDLDCLGSYLHEGWLEKKTLTADISNPLIDEAYTTAREHGAMGGKLLGAGAGGFLLVYAHEEYQPKIVAALSRFPLHRIRVEHAGSTIVFDDR